MTDYLLSENERSTISTIVTNKLREIILKGYFENGDRLIQEEWAEKLNVSRMPIREALVELEKEGLVRLEPRKGAIVMPLSGDDILEIYYLRALLEGEAIEQSLPFLEEKDLLKLEKLNQIMQSLDNDQSKIKTYIELNKEFHFILLSGCPWVRLHNMIDVLWKGIPPYTPSLLSDHLEKANKEHGLMLKYIKQNNPQKLREVLEHHIFRTRDNLVRFMFHEDE